MRKLIFWASSPGFSQLGFRMTTGLHASRDVVFRSRERPEVCACKVSVHEDLKSHGWKFLGAGRNSACLSQEAEGFRNFFNTWWPSGSLIVGYLQHDTSDPDDWNSTWQQVKVNSGFQELPAHLPSVHSAYGRGGGIWSTSHGGKPKRLASGLPGSVQKFKMWYITPLHAKASNQCVNSLIAINRVQTSHFGS